MTDARPTVSVVITTFNQSAFLARAIDSVKSNTVQPLEVVVVDDGSSDNSSGEICSRYDRVRHVRQTNQGVSGARNTGAIHASGDWIIYLDADDMLVPTAISDLGHAAHESPETAFVIGRSERRSAADSASAPQTESVTVTTDPYTDILSRDALWHPAQILFKKRHVQESGGFVLKQGAEDLELLLRLATRHPYRSISQLVSVYWLHSTNASGDPWRMYRSISTCFMAHRRDPQFITSSNAIFRRARARRLDFYSRAILLSALSDVRRGNNPWHLVRAIVFVGLRRPAVLGWFFRHFFTRTIGKLPLPALTK